MAQAFRSRKGVGSALPPTGGLQVVGCYNLDEKVAVEWEMVFDDNELLALTNELPCGHLSFDAIRLVVSSWCQARDESLASMRFTHYKVNRSSVRAIIAWAEDHNILVPNTRADSSSSDGWIHGPSQSGQLEKA